MTPPFFKLSLATLLGALALPSTHAAVFLKLDGVKGESTATGGPEVWHWYVTPLDPTQAGGVRVAVGDITGDGMDPATVALLLPAVQKVREAAAQWSGPIPSDLSQPLTATETGLLLPAVQKVREAATALPDPASASLMDLVTDLDPIGLALLLPAVQKVREAALLDQSFTGAAASDAALFSLLLPAVQHSADAAGPVQANNLVLPSLLNLPNWNQPGAVFTTSWSLRGGEVTLAMAALPVTAVPEPATWALWLGAGGMAAWLRRRRGPMRERQGLAAAA